MNLRFTLKNQRSDLNFISPPDSGMDSRTTFLMHLFLFEKNFSTSSSYDLHLLLDLMDSIQQEPLQEEYKKCLVFK